MKGQSEADKKAAMKQPFRVGESRIKMKVKRKRAVQKLGNPRIKRIHFHTLRHWRATMEYHRTKDILHVMQFLGHKRIENTLRYIQLEQMLYKESDDCICKVANSVKEAKGLIETGFEYICEYEDKRLFRKLK